MSLGVDSESIVDGRVVVASVVVVVDDDVEEDSEGVESDMGTVVVSARMLLRLVDIRIAARMPGLYAVSAVFLPVSIPTHMAARYCGSSLKESKLHGEVVVCRLSDGWLISIVSADEAAPDLPGFERAKERGEMCSRRATDH